VLLSDTVWERNSDRILNADPTVTPVIYTGPEQLPDEDVAHVRSACFSDDCWPDRTLGIMRSALAAPNLKWLHTFSTGVDSPIFRTFVERGVRLTNSAGTAASPIAQTVMMYMLAHSRDFKGFVRQQERHEWAMHRFIELEGSSLLVIGVGPIGQEIIRLAQAFNMNVTAARRTTTGSQPCPVVPLSQLHDALAQADYVALALPLNDDTRNLIDTKALACMKPGSFFMNVGRGELVDETALVEALRSGQRDHHATLEWYVHIHQWSRYRHLH
jgi:phosphoglycerate dehydrogenase-like enzyme